MNRPLLFFHNSEHAERRLTFTSFQCCGSGADSMRALPRHISTARQSGPLSPSGDMKIGSVSSVPGVHPLPNNEDVATTHHRRDPNLRSVSVSRLAVERSFCHTFTQVFPFFWLRIGSANPSKPTPQAAAGRSERDRARDCSSSFTDGKCAGATCTDVKMGKSRPRLENRGAFGIVRSVFAARFQRTKDRLHRTKTRWCNNGCKAVSSVVPPRDGWSTAHGIAPPGAQPPGRRTRGSGLRRSPLPRAVDHGVLFGHGPCHCGEHVECGFADPRPDLGRPILTYGPGRRAVAAFHRPHRELLVLLADSGTCRGFCV